MSDIVDNSAHHNMVISELGVLKSREGDIFELDFAGGEMTLFQQ